MDLDVIFRQVPALILANQQMGAQIADLDRRLKALEPQAEEDPAVSAEPPKSDQEPPSEVAPSAEAAGESQEAQEGESVPTPAENHAEASPEAPQATDQP